jgi:sugar lactone lactonase YvrE
MSAGLFMVNKGCPPSEGGSASAWHMKAIFLSTGLFTLLFTSRLTAQDIAPDSPVTTARFSSPQGVAIDGAGNVYVADSLNHTIRKISPAGMVTTLAGTAGQSDSIDGTGSAARFASPKGIAVDGIGNIYVADTFNDTIRKITPDGATLTLAGGPGLNGPADGIGNVARFSSPQGIAVDGSGNIYVADEVNQTIRKITPGWVMAAPPPIAAGRNGSAPAAGAGNATRFNLACGVTVDGSGTVYVGDDSAAVDSSGNVYLGNGNAARKISPGWVVTTLAGSAGQSGSADGKGSDARFNNPQGLALDGSGNIYVGDKDNDTIRKITPDGVVTTLAGSAGNSGSTDGVGDEARFSYPQDLALDGSGNIYVTSGNTIRKITPDGTVTTLAGNPDKSGSTDGTGSAARFRYPQGVTVDSSGTLYVVAGNAIRKITSAGVVTTLAGNPDKSGSSDGIGSTGSSSSP